MIAREDIECETFSNKQVATKKNQGTIKGKRLPKIDGSNDKQAAGIVRCRDKSSKVSKQIWWWFYLSGNFSFSFCSSGVSRNAKVIRATFAEWTIHHVDTRKEGVFSLTRRSPGLHETWQCSLSIRLLGLAALLLVHDFDFKGHRCFDHRPSQRWISIIFRSLWF